LEIPPEMGGGTRFNTVRLNTVGSPAWFSYCQLIVD
jgi:hypothetical protein